MNNNNLTDAEIKKALECCAYSEGCESCPQSKQCDGVEPLVNALDLIIRQEVEVEAWKYYYNECLTDLKTANTENESLKAKVERLKEEVAKEFTCFVGDPHKVEHCPYLEELETTKAEAYKEFAEEYKDQIKNYTGIFTDDDFYVSLQAVLSAVDFIKEKLVGEDNG